MAQPLGPQQQQLVKTIGRELLKVVPTGWKRIQADYRAAGRHIEVDVIITGPDGAARPVPPPPEVVRLFGQLRTDMYQPGRGTWISANYVIEPPASFNVDFDPDTEPRWRRLPPPIGFQDELRFFPRAEQRIPDWWRQRAGMPPAQPQPQGQQTATPAQGMPAQEAPAAPPQPQGQQTATPPQGMPAQEAPAQATSPEQLRTPRVYDGLDDAGRPVVRRQPLADAEREQVLQYLEAAPVVLAARSYDKDAFAPNEPPAVPLNFRTDGTWVWPGAVTYYLRTHQVPPDPELLAHIRGRRFTLPEVDDETKDLAVAVITGRAAAS
jgi:hypothetical protein